MKKRVTKRWFRSHVKKSLAESRKWLRQLPSRPYLAEPLTLEFEKFCLDEILPHINLTGYKLKEKEQIACHCLYNLICCGLMNRAVADSRNTGKYRTQIRVWDAIVDAGMAIKCPGSETAKKTTRYYPTDWLMRRRQMWEISLLCDLELVRNSENEGAPSLRALVVLHTGTVDWITGDPLPKDEQKKPVALSQSQFTIGHTFSSYVRKTEEEIERINENNLRHSWLARGDYKSMTGEMRQLSFQPNICLRELHAGSPFRCVRLYSWGAVSGQNLTKEQRRTMLIDGEQVVELDFASHHLRMLYHMKGIDAKGDLYKPEQIFPSFYSSKGITKTKKKKVRDLIKKATNICWNTKSKNTAASAIHTEICKASKSIKEVVFDIEKSSANDLIDRIQAVHPELKDRFFNQAAVDLMSVDGAIMKDILLQFVEAGKPAFGIHDSLVVKKTDAEFATEVMRKAYAEVFPGYEPTIEKT